MFILENSEKMNRLIFESDEIAECLQLAINALKQKNPKLAAYLRERIVRNGDFFTYIGDEVIVADYSRTELIKEV